MKFTEGGFRDWAYALAKREFGAVEIDGGPWCKLPNGIADDGITAQVLRGRETGQGEQGAGKNRTRDAMRAISQRLPP